MTADRKWMEQLGFELKHDERQGWIVIEDGADDRCATITERVLWEALIEALAASVAPAEPIGEVKRSHFGGRTRNIGFDSVVMYEGAKVSPGDKVYAAPAAPAEPTRAGRWVPIEEGLPAKYRDVIVRCRKDGETWHCVGRVNRHRQWDKATYSHDIKGQYGISDVVEWFEPDWAAAPVAPADYPECSGDPNCCPENEGYGCCKSAAPAAPALVPLTDEQIEPMFRARSRQPTEGQKDDWYFYAWGVADGESAHGINP